VNGNAFLIRATTPWALRTMVGADVAASETDELNLSKNHRVCCLTDRA